MANRNFFEALTQYRLKVEKDGKDVVNVPGLLALPGLLAAPKLSIAGLEAAPLLGLKVHLENENGDDVDVEDAVRKAAEAVKESVTTATKNIREEMDKAWEAMSADDPEEDAAEGNDEDTAEEGAEPVGGACEEHEENDVPTIDVKSDDSAGA